MRFLRWSWDIWACDMLFRRQSTVVHDRYLGYVWSQGPYLNTRYVLYNSSCISTRRRVWENSSVTIFINNDFHFLLDDVTSSTHPWWRSSSSRMVTICSISLRFGTWITFKLNVQNILLFLSCYKSCSSKESISGLMNKIGRYMMHGTVPCTIDMGIG